MNRFEIENLIARLRKHYADAILEDKYNRSVMPLDCEFAADAIKELWERCVSADPCPAADPLPAETREDILRRAAECVGGQRAQDYGKPENNFALIAKLWSAYRGIEFDAVDVAMMMALLKIARISGGNGTPDCFVDLAGYAACGGEIYAKGGAPIERR